MPSGRTVRLALTWGLVIAAANAGQAFAQRLQVEAMAGTPFGVGRVVLPASGEMPGNPWADGRVDIFERNGRVLYPVLSDGPVRQLFRQFVQVRRNLVIYFLFKGNEPLDLTVTVPDAVPLQVRPQRNQLGAYRRLLTGWWRDYSRAAQQRVRSSDYPGTIDNYLTSTLARRLGLPAPNLEPRGLFAPRRDDGLEMLLGTESMLGRIQRRGLLGPGQVASAALEALPPEPVWDPIAYPPAADPVDIEPIANYVPEDWLYLRCGTYANYVWMQTVMDEWGGELRNMITERGVEYGINARMERMLGLQDTILGRTFGGTIISDVAFVGTDPFLREGAAIGMLFEASNNFLLGQSLSKQRNDAVARENGQAIQETVEIDGHEVSFFHTPDGGLRSFYASVDNYHLVTSSRELMRQFLAVGKAKGAGSLGKSEGLRYARSLLPVQRNDTLFLYLSDAFFRRLASPQYRIEMARRLRSIAEMQSLRLARLAAVAEGVAAGPIDELIAADLLPPGFANRVDGSRIVVDGDQMKDSIRGVLGSFVPVPDMPTDGISPVEAAEYEAFVQAYRSSPSRMDPLAVAIHRTPTELSGLEGITIDVFNAPLRAPQYQRLSRYFGAPRVERMASVPGELLRVEGVGPKNNYLFLGIQDFRPPLAVRGGRVQWTLPTYDTLRGYLGGSPNLGIVEQLLSLVFGRPSGQDAEGYVVWPLGLWQWSDGGMTLLSFKRDVLQWVLPQLTFQDLGRPAQLHFDVDDLTQRELAWAANAYGYQHARNVSIGNTMFLQSLARQLHAPRDRCLEIAEHLVDGTLVCALGGAYKHESADGRGFWTSTAWSGANRDALTQIPEDYVFPVMQWFRGATGEMLAQPDMLAGRVELLMQRKPPTNKFKWPDFTKPGEAPKPAPEPAAQPDEPSFKLPEFKLPDINLGKPEELPPPVPTPPAPTAPSEP